VNGVAITQADLDERTRRTPAAGAPGHDVAGNVLQTVVREELVAQKAAELGLDQEPGYRASLDALEAQVRAYRRQQLAEHWRTWVQNRATPTDAEARAWFDKNEALVRTRFHVLQILRKNEPAEIARDRADLKAGTPFAQVAARRYPEVPAGSATPWDVGEMGWAQLPAPWRGIVDRLEPGQSSDVIEGQGGRAWVIQLAGKRVDPAITFETEKDRIVQVLRQEKAAALYESALGELRDHARITYAKDAPAPAPAARPD
jgi:parvulin-like peptidyl-prolyl isomerase